jgi:hypothetical protein
MSNSAHLRIAAWGKVADNHDGRCEICDEWLDDYGKCPRTENHDDDGAVGWSPDMYVPNCAPVMTREVTTWVHPDAAAMLITAYTVREESECS